MKIDLVGRETGRPVDREEERIGLVSLVSRYTGLPPTIFVRIRRGDARGDTGLLRVTYQRQCRLR